jgi:hypothetical protein
MSKALLTTHGPGSPPTLSPASRKLFKALCAEYGIADTGGREILHSGLRALDQATKAEVQIEHDGQCAKDRFGQLRGHPLLSVARDFRAQWLMALKALNLNIGDPVKTGRPGAEDQ